MSLAGRSVTRAWGRFLALVVLAFASLALNGAPQAGETAALPAIAVAQLPREARDTLVLIERGGPFPYERDGVAFGNFEKRLPLKARGYYREYTVRTPGVKHRGARRIVAGAKGERYYTDDHYQSFRRIVK